MKRKKKKSRPRAVESFNIFKAEAFKHYIKEMEERTQEFAKRNPNSCFRYSGVFPAEGGTFLLRQESTQRMRHRGGT